MIRTGISGWTYPPWRKVFYPSGLAHARELGYAASKLTSIEINGSFYALQKPTSYQKWYDETPDGFVFSVKGPRFVTHMKKLADVEGPLANFFASGLLALGNKLGPVLWQLPPTLGYDAPRLASFFAQLPRTTGEAASLAARHEDRMSGRAFTQALVDQPLRHALEVRHTSYQVGEFVELLREHDIALVNADSAGKWPMLDDVTSDFVYLRLHGAEELYVSGYDDEALDRCSAGPISRWLITGPPVPVLTELEPLSTSYSPKDLSRRDVNDKHGGLTVIPVPSPTHNVESSADAPTFEFTPLSSLLPDPATSSPATASTSLLSVRSELTSYSWQKPFSRLITRTIQSLLLYPLQVLQVQRSRARWHLLPHMHLLRRMLPLQHLTLQLHQLRC